jgi:hypothetical protein
MRAKLADSCEATLDCQEVAQIGGRSDPTDNYYFIALGYFSTWNIQGCIYSGGYDHYIPVPRHELVRQHAIAADHKVTQTSQPLGKPTVPMKVDCVVNVKDSRTLSQVLKSGECRQHFPLQ